MVAEDFFHGFGDFLVAGGYVGVLFHVWDVDVVHERGVGDVSVVLDVDFFIWNNLGRFLMGVFGCLGE